ncbi:MAG: hypothetical protein A2Y57_03245, partial [Candidatus Woykebacteria bacterium RBG_13_40_7b]
KDREEAIKIGQNLLQKRLAACYNFFPIESAYWWKGKIEQQKEFALFIKSKEELFGKVEKEIIQTHSYSTPEIAAIKVDKINKPYLDWLTASLS